MERVCEGVEGEEGHQVSSCAGGQLAQQCRTHSNHLRHTQLLRPQPSQLWGTGRASALLNTPANTAPAQLSGRRQANWV